MNYRRVFSPEFKRESASLVLDQGYSTRESSEAVGVGTSSIRRWVRQLETERRGVTPQGRCKAMTSEQRKIQELEQQIKRIEMENEILKKATALLMSDPKRS